MSEKVDSLMKGGKFAAGMVIKEKYQLGGEITKSGSAVIFEMVDLTEKEVKKIVKIQLLDNRTNMIGNEVNLLRQLRGAPGFSTFYESFNLVGCNFMVMSNDGMPIELSLRRQAVSQDSLVKIGLKLCGAINHLHSIGWLHRDVHTGNILVKVDGNNKLGITLIDFGLSTPINAPHTSRRWASLHASYHVCKDRPYRPIDDFYSIIFCLIRCAGEQPFGDIMEGRNKQIQLARKKAFHYHPIRNILNPRNSWLGELYQKLKAMEIDFESGKVAEIFRQDHPGVTQDAEIAYETRDGIIHIE